MAASAPRWPRRSRARGSRSTARWGAAPTARGADIVLLCVPDGQISAAADHVAAGRLVGHTSGATGLDPLAPHDAFSLHPLMTVTSAGADLRGIACAVAGSTPAALGTATALAERLGAVPLHVPDDRRAVYHAAASVASNFLVTLQGAAERLAAGAGVDRVHLVPLVRAAVDNWAAHGPAHALTGPVARGDEATVARQRDAIGEHAPELLVLFDALAQATRELAAEARS